MSNMSPNVVYCTYCQGSLPPNANTCMHCGATLPWAPYESVYANTSPPPPPMYPQSQQQYPPMMQQPQVTYIQQQYPAQPYVQQTYGQPVAVVNIVNSAPPAPVYYCPRCQCQTFPRFQESISTGGWVCFAILLVLFFPLFWIGLLMKDRYMTCGRCGFRMS